VSLRFPAHLATLWQSGETLIEYSPKNGKARFVPLPHVACDELRTIFKAQREYRLAHGEEWNVAGQVLPKRDGAPMSPSSLKSMWLT
jgi:hypothetical protein